MITRTLLTMCVFSPLLSCVPFNPDWDGTVVGDEEGRDIERGAPAGG